VVICPRCKTANERRRIRFGKTGRYLEIVGCQCQAIRLFLKYENTKFPEETDQKIA
jgi:hypothetical protein